MLECSKNVYKFKLPFSVLIKLRDQGIDFISATAWADLEKELKNIYPILREGISYAEGKDITDEEVEEIVDELMETIGLDELEYKIMDAISIKGAARSEDFKEALKENREEEEIAPKKKK